MRATLQRELLIARIESQWRQQREEKLRQVVRLLLSDAAVFHDATGTFSALSCGRAIGGTNCHSMLQTGKGGVAAGGSAWPAWTWKHRSNGFLIIELEIINRMISLAASRWNASLILYELASRLHAEPTPHAITMSAYAGFTKTSYGAQGADDSGGFFAGGSQQGSQGGGGGKSYQDESLRPVTIKQILDAEEAYAGADFRIDNAPVNPQPTNITLKIDDGTGQMEVKKWIDVDKQDDTDPGYELDAHVRVWGRLKSFNNKRHVGAHVIRPVTDFNEVNYHMLESTYVHLYFTKGPLGGQGGANGEGDSMFVDGGGYNDQAGGNVGQTPTKLAGCTPLGKKVFNFMNDSPGGNEGVHLNVITNSLGLSVRDVLTAADDLLGHGLIYTTVDDETWAILEY
ncbi:hypothetical protein NM208_g15756 [Fusarium decemcellulare]|uniref:Uncharacterized protein n=1 Tax=Fusarium decemcellulare TaxID=57161 RepID=A0ACC1RGC4_9HYPO|nr:hypothetical protein NM208_g15756 [Fusarium decemcellulare]